MGENWRGKAVSIECDGNLGVFQGIIKSTTEANITISRAFRNGVPLKKQHAEITLRCADIKKISLIPAFDGQNTITPAVNTKPNYVKKPNFSKSAPNATSYTQSNTVTANNHNNQKGQNQKQQQPRPSTSKGDNVNLNKQFNNLDISTRAPNNNASNDLLSNGTNGTNNKSSPPNWCSNSVAQFFGNLIPPKVEVRMGASCSSSASTAAKNSNNAESNSGLSNNIGSSSSSKPIDIVYTNGSYYGQPQNSAASSTNSNGKMRINGNGNGNSNGNGNGYALQYNGNAGSNSNKKQRKNIRRDNSFKQKQTFGTSVDDPEIYEEFDFEGNLALFDKQALWHVIEKAEQKPDGRQLEANPQTKFRHDENIIESEPLELRQIESTFASYTEFVTDDGLIIPTIPMYVRTKIESTAEKSGMLFSRQYEILARGVCDLAILLLGGARRLTPNNCHQWPKIVIICDTRINTRAIDVGATTGRQLASHGLNVTLFLEDKNATEHNTEIILFKATENKVVDVVSALPNPDLVILSTNSPVLTQSVKNWLKETRASILSIDPPPNGVPGVSIKYSILPILPLNGISTNNCGKLYLCNLGIPDIYFRDAGVKYKSPFGHKSILPIHLKD